MRAKNTPKGDWIIGQGWDEGAWANRYPDKSLLSQVTPDHPVFLSRLHGFSYVWVIYSGQVGLMLSWAGVDTGHGTRLRVMP